jgi:hypothetical protein
MKLYKPVKDFAPGVRIAFSSVDDGSIAAGGGKLSTEQHEQNADKFLSTYFGTTNRAKVRVTYDADNTYTHCERVTSQNANQSIRSDALYTTIHPEKEDHRSRNRLACTPSPSWGVV